MIVLWSAILSTMDTILTAVIIFHGGIELNPLCFSIPVFIGIKIAMTLGLYGFWAAIKITKIELTTSIKMLAAIFDVVYLVAIIHNIVMMVVHWWL